MNRRLTPPANRPIDHLTLRGNATGRTSNLLLKRNPSSLGSPMTNSLSQRRHEPSSLATSGHQSRRGIVLVMVLAMLSLFSVLVAGYVVFSTQSASVMPFDPVPAIPEIDLNKLLDDGRKSVTHGSVNHHSATYRHSLLEDLYGNDGVVTRVAAANAAPGTGFPLQSSVGAGPDIRGMLLHPIDLTLTTQPRVLFKIPTRYAPWDRDFAASPDDPLAMDDWAAGRGLTFTEGPLEGQTLTIIRSFGYDTEAPGALAGSVIVDLAELEITEVYIDDIPRDVFVVAASTPNSLLYTAPIDPVTNQPEEDDPPGADGVDDDGDGFTDEEDERGYPGGDDRPYDFVINGAMFNGGGHNANGIDGIYDHAADAAIDPAASFELQVNHALIGPDRGPGSAQDVSFQNGIQADEAWDAPDFENLFLAWQPSDHRKPGYGSTLPVYPASVTNAAELNENLGSAIIPSFHRPALINYLVNMPIRTPAETSGGTPRTFWDIRAYYQANAMLEFPSDGDGPLTDATPDDADRLITLATRLRRATLRPLNFAHLATSNIGWQGVNDLDGDSLDDEGAPEFSGTNPVPYATVPVDYNDAGDLIDGIYNLSRWMANGPWDVDNDGDGLADSVWVDLGMDELAAPDGTIVKPMFAALIEDLDGKIDVNAAGNLMQIAAEAFPASRPLSTVVSGPNVAVEGSQYAQATTALNVFGRGGGVGPAEIDFSHLFDSGRATSFAQPPYGPVGDLTQLSGVITRGLGTFDPLHYRYGNLLNLRYGGSIFDYRVQNPDADLYHYPGDGIGSSAVPVSNDISARTLFPARQDSLAPVQPMGLPMDLFGLNMYRSRPSGGTTVSTLAVPTTGDVPAADTSNDLFNQPYEQFIGGTDDNRFEPADYLATYRGAIRGPLGQLIADEIDRNPALRDQITTESRTILTPEHRGYRSMVDFFQSRLQMPTASVTERQALVRNIALMLAPEFRKGELLNLNRQLGNGVDDTGSLIDETAETTGGELAFPALELLFPGTTVDGDAPDEVAANYAALPSSLPSDEFSGSGATVPPDHYELLARQLYCLTYLLVADVETFVSGSGSFTTTDLFPNYPFPDGDPTTAAYGPTPAYGQPATEAFGTVEFRNRYVARRIAQWAANAVDYRDTNAICTRLRYDPNLLDATGFDTAVAAVHRLWGMERPELEITETLAFHDKRLKRNLEQQPGALPAGEEDEDDPSGPGQTADSDMDQFRIPQGSAFVELHSLRDYDPSDTTVEATYPAELFDTEGRLDLGRVVGTGDAASPVWRLAIGEPTKPDAATDGDRNKSPRWVFDPLRMTQEVLPIDPLFQEPLGFDATDTPEDAFETDASLLASAEVFDISNTSVAFVDDDLDPASYPSPITLTRFVWFARLLPAPSLDVFGTGAGSITPAQVFANFADSSTHPIDDPVVTDPADLSLPQNAYPRLEPGQYAMVGPRPTTVLGQLKTSDTDPTFPYQPSDQALSMTNQGVFDGTAGDPDWRYRFNYTNATATGSLTPRYRDDTTDTDTIFGAMVRSVQPILVRSLYPNEIDPTATGWATYLGGTAADERVEIGFNISEPLSGAGYYTAPTQKINESGGDEYPLVDGYRNYTSGTGLHPDRPLDYEASSPLGDHDWRADGTYEEAATVFLQRLADPTLPWDAIENPYVTVDFMPMDLTVFNGESDTQDTISGGSRDGQVADGFVDGTGPPTELIEGVTRFDSRRKIPDVSRDRVATNLPQTGGTVVYPDPMGPPFVDLSNFSRLSVTQRPRLSSTFSTLRITGATETSSQFEHRLGSLWTDTHAVDTTLTIDSSFIENAPFVGTSTLLGGQPDPIGNSQFDVDPYRQTLGFVNREYGLPGNHDGTATTDHISILSHDFVRGEPVDSEFIAPRWADRDFQSPMELIHVPAYGAGSLSQYLSPGTRLSDDGERESPARFEHLLPFVDRRAETDSIATSTVDASTPGPVVDGVDVAVTGERRTPFELLLDYVYTDNPNYADDHWYDPAGVLIGSNPNSNTGIDAMFDLAVANLQPPYNYRPSRLISGRVNLNTMPDYVRPGGGSLTSNAARPFYLDFAENAEDNTAPTPSTRIVQSIIFNDQTSSPNYSGVGPFSTTSGNGDVPLFANGSVFRSFAWSGSTAYGLDFELEGSGVRHQRPAVMGSDNATGETDRYSRTTETSFGYGFKSFIESRRGYPSITRSSYSPTAAQTTGQNELGNLLLDHRLPTQFAGVFATADAARAAPVQRYLRTPIDDPTIPSLSAGTPTPTDSIRRRTTDMTLLRPHPDFDLRTVQPTFRTDFDTAANTERYTGYPEQEPTGNPAGVPAPPTGTYPVESLRMTRDGGGVFERTLPELHGDFRHLARHAEHRFENASRYANLTTHHSNVYRVRLTVGLFVVDGQGAPGEEYTDINGRTVRGSMTSIVDRSLPVGFVRGQDINTDQTVLYQEFDQ